MIYAVFSGFVLALLAPWVHAANPRYSGGLLALLPALLFAWFASLLPQLGENGVLLQSWPWMPGLAIELSFLLDGLSLLFALLITGIGALVLLYAGAYLSGHEYLGRFYAILLSFMAAMLGLVLSDNLISLFVFWELTSITSYLLIGFNHQDADARRAALQGLLVTAGGGLVLMAGLVLLAIAGDSYRLSELLAEPALIRQSPLLAGMMLCILVGAFTKSAQFPFHFWLPNAMAAPTPVSAYLHSATMVKAGIYLMARLNPVFAGEALWSLLLSAVGAMTMLTGAWLAYSACSLKKVLAYSTVMALGTLTLLLGIGSQAALTAFVCFLLAHALYKGALFMLAGSIDHASGCKDLRILGGLRKTMPVTAVLLVLACLSLAGLPPLFGFVAKELLFEAVLSASLLADLLFMVVMISAMLTAAVAGVFAWQLVWGQAGDLPRQPHEAPPAMLAGPLLLAVMSLLFGLWPQWPASVLVQQALAATGAQGDVKLALWHGFNLPLLLSLISVAGALILINRWPAWQARLAVVSERLARFGPQAGYFHWLNGLVLFAAWQTRVLQNGKTGNYMLVLILTAVGLTGYTLLSQQGISLPDFSSSVRFYELTVAMLMLLSVAYVIGTRSRLGAVAMMGVLGFSVALVFILFSAPDLGITQVLVETLTVILLVLVLFRLPGFAHYSSRSEIIRDAVVALAFGSLMMLLMLAALDVRYFESISRFYVENSYTQAHGKNIVNVILVDFRALDTLGEIFVLGIAALGVFSMLKLQGARKP